jgi:hypothetical protein
VIARLVNAETDDELALGPGIVSAVPDAGIDEGALCGDVLLDQTGIGATDPGNPRTPPVR